MFSKGDIILWNGRKASVLLRYTDAVMPYLTIQFDNGGKQHVWEHTCELYNPFSDIENLGYSKKDIKRLEKCNVKETI